MSSVILTNQPSTPVSPTTGKLRLYFGADGNLRSVDSNGVVIIYGPSVTPAQVEDIINTYLVAGAGIVLTQEPNNTLQIASSITQYTDNLAIAAIANALLNSSTISFSYNATTHKITAVATLTKSDVGLSNVDNTSDLNKPISTAAQTALNGKENTIAAGTTSQYWRGDKTWQTLDKSAVGLSNVDNTSDLNKPISTATQTALNLKVNTSLLGVANGVATLDATGKVPSIQLPSYVDDVLEFANLAAFPAIGETGKIYVALDTNIIYRWSGSVYIVISASPGTTDAVPEGLINLYYTNARASAAAPVQSVSGRTGAVVLTSTDVGLGNVNNTSDLNKPISTATQTALNLKANLASPVLTGTPTAPTPSVGDSSTNIATTAFVTSAISTASVPDATTTIKGKLQLAGDLSGTAALPTVPGLLTKEPIITAGTTSQYWRGDKTWQTLDKTAVGLSNVDNTSDLNKPLSTAAQTALNLKADKVITITAGTGLSGGGDLTANRTLALANTAVTAGSYGDNSHSSTITVNPQGQLTAATSTPIQITESQVTNLSTDLLAKANSAVTISAGAGLVGGGDLSSNRTLALSTTGVTASTYGSATQVPTISVDAYGRLSSAANTPIQIAESQVTNLSTDLSGKVGTATQVIAGTGLSGGGALTSNVTLSLPNVGTAGTVGDATHSDVITTDAQGRVTGITTALIAIPHTQITDWSTAVQGIINVSDTTSIDMTDTAGVISGVVLPAGVDHNALQNFVINKHIDHSTVNISAGAGLSGGGDLTATRTISMPNVGTPGGFGDSSHIPTITTDAQGRVVSATTNAVLISESQVTNLTTDLAGKVPTTTTVSAGTGLTGGGALSAPVTLSIASTGVTAASYGTATQTPTITVNAQGQLTTASNTTIALPHSQITDFDVAVKGLINVVDTASIDMTYSSGNISGVVLPAGVNHDALQNYVANKHIDHSTVSIVAGTGLIGGGDLTTSRTLSLSNVGTAGTYGDASHYPIFTVDAQGRVTGISTTSSDIHWVVDTTIDSGGLLTWSDGTGQDLVIRQANASIGSAYIRQVSSNGSLAAPTPTTSGQRVGGNGFYGWSTPSLTGVDSLPCAAICGYATENHSASANGGEMRVELIPNGSTTPVTTATFQNDGDLTLTGAVALGNTASPVVGMLRYNGTELQGYQGTTWYPIAPTITYLNSTTAATSTSATFAILSSMTVTPAAGTYKLDFTCASSISNVSSIGNFGVFIAGVEQAQCRRTIANGAATVVNNSVAISTIITVNGSQAVTVQFNRSSGTGTITVNARELILMPISR